MASFGERLRDSFIWTGEWTVSRRFRRKIKELRARGEIGYNGLTIEENTHSSRYFTVFDRQGREIVSVLPHNAKKSGQTMKLLLFYPPDMPFGTSSVLREIGGKFSISEPLTLIETNPGASDDVRLWEDLPRDKKVEVVKDFGIA